MARRPNILLITSDQHHRNALGYLNPELKTPSLDRLAREGTDFSRAYCPNPTCTPTRASIITGQYPSQHGAWTLGTKLMESKHTVGEDFQAAGYRTALVGKAHFQPLTGTPEFPSIESYPIMQDLEFWRQFNGPFYGFEHVELLRNHVDEAHAGQHYALWMEAKGLTNWRDHFVPPTGTRKHGDTRWELPEEFHYNNFISERTNALLAEYAEANEPFWLWASFPDPHPPYLVPDPWHGMYDETKLTVPEVSEGEHAKNPEHFRWTQTPEGDFASWRETGFGIHGCHSHLTSREERAHNLAVYYGMVSFMDAHIGRILDKLDALGLTEDTLVLFTTDHGHFLGQHGLVAKGPFMYEDLIKLPFVMRYPGKVPAGRNCAALQTLVDLAPTFLDFCGVKIPCAMTGVSQKAVWLGQAVQARDHIVCEHHHEPSTIHIKTYVNQRYKLTVYHQQDYGELFDLQEDPGELNNLWHDPAAQELKTELTRQLLFAEMGKESLPMPRVAGA